MNRSEVLGVIFAAITRVNEILTTGEQLEPAEDTMLYGDEGGLDSLGLVSLVSDVEQSVSDLTGITIVLADESALSQRYSPFRSVSALADYVVQKLQNGEAFEGARFDR